MERSKLQIGQRLGAGGLAEVHEVTIDGRRAVVKTLPEHSDHDALARLRHEGEVTSSLAHPNIRGLIEQGERSLVLEHLDLSLADVLQAAGALPIDAAVYIVSELLRALDHAHRQGRIHRDVTAANVLMTMDGAIKLADFETSKKLGTAPTAGWMIRGTRGYMSPEQLNGDELDERSDVFSAGVVLYELLTGEMPFGRTHESMLAGLYGPNPPVPVQRHRPELAQQERLLAALDQMLERSRAGRCSSTTAALDALPGYRQGRAELIDRLAELVSEGALDLQADDVFDQEADSSRGEPFVPGEPTIRTEPQQTTKPRSHLVVLFTVGLAFFVASVSLVVQVWPERGSIDATEPATTSRSSWLIRHQRIDRHYPGDKEPGPGPRAGDVHRPLSSPSSRTP